MLNPVVHADVVEVYRTVFVVAREQVRHVLGHEVAECRSEVECLADRNAHVLVWDVPPVARNDAWADEIGLEKKGKNINHKISP